MEIDQAPLPGVFLLTPKRFGDDRGFFCESWNAQRMAEAGLDIAFVQDNHSLSKTPGTLRGLHFQSPPHAQAKLVRCGRGRLWDFAVDIRNGSPIFGQWFGTELSFENGRQLLIPAGFLHGSGTLTPDTEVVYKCSDYYAPDCDGGVAWDDPDLAIAWPKEALAEGGPMLSGKDAAAPKMAEFDSPFTYEAGT